MRTSALHRLLDSPYFGRVEFQSSEAAQSEAHYIGVHSLRDPSSRDLVVHDWRAPISSLYYDFESGPASFLAPEGVREGQITGKRQYKIEHGELQYSLESRTR